MKKRKLVKLFFLFITFLSFIFVPMASQADTLGAGDLNNDLIVDIRDAILALQILSRQEITGSPDLNADVDGNQLIGMEEALYALQIAAELREPPVLQAVWSRSIGYGDTYADYHSDSLRQTSDDGYIFVYETIYGGAGGYDFGIAKTDPGGIMQWAKVWGGSSIEAPKTVLEAHGGGYLVAGDSYSFRTGSRYCDIILLKLNADGSLAWQKNIGDTGYDIPEVMESVTDAGGNPDGYIMAAYTTSFGAGGRDIWLLRLNNDGNIVWQKTYGGSGDEYPRAIKPTPDGGFILASDTQSFGAGGRDVWVVKLDANGTVEWEKAYGGFGAEFPVGIEPVGTDAYVVGARTGSFGNGEDFWVFKIDADGDLLWNYTYGGTDDDSAQDLRKSDDGGFMMVGWTYSFGVDYNDALLIKLDADGSIIWQKIYNKPYEYDGEIMNGPDWAYSVTPTSDGGYAVIGDTDFWDSERNSDIWLFKVDSTGKLGCGIAMDSSATANGSNIVSITGANAYSVSSTAVVPGNPAGIFSTIHPEEFVHCEP
ncbi:MAG: hypothetical protein JXA41_07375 [Deltaproteobacteria bacterium]|nr:hypothetical protein [Deltaproteobacteria bacterium]